MVRRSLMKLTVVGDVDDRFGSGEKVLFRYSVPCAISDMILRFLHNALHHVHRAGDIFHRRRLGSSERVRPSVVEKEVVVLFKKIEERGKGKSSGGELIREGVIDVTIPSFGGGGNEARCEGAGIERVWPAESVSCFVELLRCDGLTAGAFGLTSCGDG